MSQQDLLKRVVAALERLGIDYMITGSIASSLQGEPPEWARFLGVERELARIRSESEPV